MKETLPHPKQLFFIILNSICTLTSPIVQGEPGSEGSTGPQGPEVSFEACGCIHTLLLALPLTCFLPSLLFREAQVKQVAVVLLVPRVTPGHLVLLGNQALQE